MDINPMLIRLLKILFVPIFMTMIDSVNPIQKKYQNAFIPIITTMISKKSHIKKNYNIHTYMIIIKKIALIRPK